LKRSEHFGDLGMDRIIILKWLIEKLYVKVCGLGSLADDKSPLAGFL
jgi:hypothetical protein